MNPQDYFVWSYVENITNKTSHNTKASLIVEKACSQFRIRIEVVIDAECGYIK